ncbi:ABC transporter substrate-binding protein [Clostridioides difficile]
MKKRVLAMILSATLAVGMFGCGSKDQGQSTQSADGEIKITFPTYMAGENVGAVFFVPQIERFNEKYDGKYEIVIEEIPQASYAEKIKQLAQQNKLPVIVHSPGSGGIDLQWFQNVVIANDMAYDLTSFAESHPETAATWNEESREYSTVDGKLVTKPLAVVKPMGLYYNSSMYKSDKDIKDQTMDEFIGGLGENLIAFQTADNGWTTGLLLSAIIANQEGGLELIKNSVDEKLYDYTDPIIVKSVEILQKVMQTNGSSNTVGAAYADAANAFMSKKASIICNGSWMASEFGEDAADKWSNDFNGADVKSTIYPGNIALVNTHAFGEFWVSNSATDEEKEVAEAFLEFRDSKEEIEALILAEGGVCTGIEYSDEFLTKQKETPILAQLADSIDDTTTYAVSILDVMPASVADVEFGKLLPKLIDNTLTAEEFCVELSKKAEEAR